MVSIIIPAYNEEAVIGRTLNCLKDSSESADIDIIVCCNGCTDRTAEIARGFGPKVRVLETSKGSKTLALNMGDSAARSFPRIYLDADILLNSKAVNSIVWALANTKALAVAPRLRVDLAGRSWAIRAFYNVWLKTPYHLHGMIGSGVYALSEIGRSRFQEFPDIIADDGYVYALFSPDERMTLEDCSFTITPPVTMGGLLRIKTRSKLGMKQLTRRYPELMERLAASKAIDGNSGYWNLFRQPLLWPQMCVFLFVKIICTIRANAQLKRLSEYRWERDETSRV